MKKLLLSLAAVAMVASAAQAQTLSDLRLGIFVGDDVASQSQERAALNWVQDECPSVKVYKPATLATLSTTEVDVLWVHIDRVGLDAGWQNLPSAFCSDAVVSALKTFYQDGGSLFLTKQATQLATAIGLIDKEANCFSSGDGGEGTDTWTIQAVLGCADGLDPLDRRSHEIYSLMDDCDDFGHPSFPLLGTGDPETSLWREDHNCFWIPADLGFGAGNGDINSVKDFEIAYNCQILGTWGHVADYCGAGIIDFNGGRALTIGLAAYELAPRNGGNAYTDNIDILTSNSLRYLAEHSATGIESISLSGADMQNATPEYFNLQGIRVANTQPGVVYIRKAGSEVKKVVL